MLPLAKRRVIVKKVVIVEDFNALRKSMLAIALRRGGKHAKISVSES